MPAQITWRADEALIARLRLHADHHKLSMNEFITQVMSTVTDPTFAASPSEQVRERLRSAGLLVDLPPDDIDTDIDWDEVDRARIRAARGTPLSQIVIDGR